MQANGSGRIDTGDTVHCPMWAVIISERTGKESIVAIFGSRGKAYFMARWMYGEQNWRVVPVLADVEIHMPPPPTVGIAGRGGAA